MSSRVNLKDTKVLTRLNSWDDVNYKLKEISDSQRVIAQTESDMNDMIRDIKMESELKIKPHKDKIDALQTEIKEFTEANKSDINGKSKTFTFGKVGFRKSTKIDLIKTAAEVIKQLKHLKLNECIKVKEDVDKSKLKTYPEEILKAVGAQRIEDDTFYYELNNQKIT